MSRRKKIRPEIRTDTWLATFADTMTLLLTFFVVLYSFSTVDATKFKQVASSFQSVLTGETTKSSLNFNVKDGDVPLVGLPLKSGAAGNDAQNIYKKVQSFIINKKLESIVEIKTDNRGVIIQLRENIIFESGNAEIIDKSKPVLNSINALISTFPNDIVIEGHTDNEPISNSKYKNNWQLSSDRALQVLEYFVVTKGQARPNRFKSVACGEYQPIAANNSDANRALNRRVNILIVSNDKEVITK
ncbi:flagellar motor protein MotB [Clostridium estertheticum]|uniref:flagellar motor protein MotB n=1 Tax=Clostridium estertheticum TaxID=238834 RepID=UPI001C6DF37B|nr:flagellar motor protein MotB [Clostridium estertheticum]MBW9151934.1 OmpA family protein [Clostridium estertheticum]WLC85328.1 OmpA family protein [Clostridium estertheticum]